MTLARHCEVCVSKFLTLDLRNEFTGTIQCLPHMLNHFTRVSLGLRNTKECSMTYRQSETYNHKLPQKLTYHYSLFQPREMWSTTWRFPLDETGRTGKFLWLNHFTAICCSFGTSPKLNFLPYIWPSNAGVQKIDQNWNTETPNFKTQGGPLE